MKIAILSDIHGNALALRAVLDAARRQGAERLLVAGDLVGYYFSPGECLAMLAEWPFDMVKGNHEVMLAEARRDPERLDAYGARFGSGLAMALAQLSAEQLDWLEALPHPLQLELGGMRILLCHGAPWDAHRYLYPDTPAELFARCWALGHEAVILGHTHYPLHLTQAGRFLINPGSVGQPRHRRPGAWWGLLDTHRREYQARCEAYAVASLVTEARVRHPEIPYLAEVLERR